MPKLVEDFYQHPGTEYTDDEEAPCELCPLNPDAPTPRDVLRQPHAECQEAFRELQTERHDNDYQQWKDELRRRMTTIPLQTEAEIDATPSADDLRLWSVTTILDSTGGEGGLINWTGTTVAQAAIDTQPIWQAMIDKQGEAAAVQWIAKQRFNPPKGQRSATNLGKAVHASIEILTVTGKRPQLGDPLPGKNLGIYDAELEPYMDSFDLFLDRFQPTYTAAEMVVYNLTYGYAGQLDGMAHVQGPHVVIDYKTSRDSLDGSGNRKKPWKTAPMQAAGYQHAEYAAAGKARKVEKWSERYYLLNQEERNQLVPMPPSEGALVIHITPEHCDVYNAYGDASPDEVFERFLYAIESARTDLQLSANWLTPLWLMDRKPA